jgi:UDP-galactopyranose mutase
MDAWDAFDFAPPDFAECEAELLAHVDLVFTGGPSLYEAKADRHPHVHLFPSSVDVEHFARARRPQADPVDQAQIPRPRLGFVGTIDERLDRELLDGLAAARPDWQFVMIGPVIKIERASLPRRPNIWYLDGKPYKELPSYLAGWDVALIPFALNRATRFISPTKTPEYLAAGRPVVSTPVRDVVHPYGELGLVWIAGTVTELVAACAAALAEGRARLPKIDAFLARTSWDRTAMEMANLLDVAISGHVTAP